MKDEIRAELDKQAISDLDTVMSTEEGRRFFSWLKLLCGENRTSFTGNSQTYFNEGQRNIALLLDLYLDSMGIQGINFRHQAEKEYAYLQSDIKSNIEQTLKKKQGG